MLLGAGCGVNPWASCGARPGHTAMLLKYVDVQLCMIYLPDRAGSRGLAPVDQIQGLTVGSCAPVSESRQSTGKSDHDPADHGIARPSFPKRACDGSGLSVDR